MSNEWDVPKDCTVSGEIIEAGRYWRFNAHTLHLRNKCTKYRMNRVSIYVTFINDTLLLEAWWTQKIMILSPYRVAPARFWQIFMLFFRIWAYNLALELGSQEISIAMRPLVSYLLVCEIFTFHDLHMLFNRGYCKGITFS